MNKKVLYIIIPVLAVVVSFNFFSNDNTSQSSSACVMTSKQFSEADKSKAIIIDVRTPAEFNSGHVEGAKSIDINSYKFKDEISKLDKDQAYYVYCKTGIRSRKAAGYMKQTGFKNVCELEGGVRELAREGVKVVN